MTVMNGQQIFENFANGPGPEPLAVAQETLGGVVAEYRELAAAIAGVAAAFEEGWTGDAAGAAERGAGPLTEQHVGASEALDVAQELLRRQVESFWLAKNTVEPVPPVPPAPSSMENVITFGSAGASYEQFVTESNAVAQRNVAAMELWTNHCTYNTEMMPTSYGEISAPTASVSLTPSTQYGGGPGPDDVDKAASTSDVPGGSANSPEPGTTPGPETPGAPAEPRPGTTEGTPTEPGTTPGGTEAAVAHPGTANSGVPPTSTGPANPGTSAPGTPAPATPLPTAPGTPAPRSTPGPRSTQATPGPRAPQGTPGPRVPQETPGPRSTQGAPGPAPTRAPQPLPGDSRPAPQSAPTPGTRVTGQAKGATPIATPAAARGRGAEDAEHERRYGLPEDKHFQPGEDGEKIIDPRTGLPASQPVIGG